MLYDWPYPEDSDAELNQRDKLHLGASGENAGYAVAQFATAYCDISIVGYYFAKAKLAYVFHPQSTLMADKCSLFRNVSPDELHVRLTEYFKKDYGWRILIAAAPESRSYSTANDPHANPDGGISMSLRTLANTFPKSGEEQRLPNLEFWLPGPEA